MTEKVPCLQYFLCAHASGNDGDAITLLSEAWRAHRNEIAGALSDDQFRFAVGTFKVMNEADCLASFHLCAEFEGDFKNARLWGEQVVLAIQRLGENCRGFSETGPCLRATFQDADMD